ncbi:MAG TPA: hypothetical protein VN752_00285 [Solirubrobacterales bacterium]|nr:hypothetical protein [Solirubrobacterales bacterium]
MADESKTRPPRGALVVIAVGLLATVAAALLSTDKPIGAATLEWVEESKMPDSQAAAIPSGGQMQLSDGLIRATEPNVSDYTLYQTSALLKIDAGSAVGSGRVRCSIRVPKRTIVAKTHSSRASYPRSSEELAEQEAPESPLVEFSSHSTDLASVELGDVLGKRYTAVSGIVVEWAPFRIGQQVWQWGLPRGRPKEDLTLPFASIWRTTTSPAAKIACTIETAAGTSTIRTAGSLSR